MNAPQHQFATELGEAQASPVFLVTPQRIADIAHKTKPLFSPPATDCPSTAECEKIASQRHKFDEKSHFERGGHYAPWTKREDEIVKEMRLARASYAKIGAAIGRKPRAIRERWRTIRQRDGIKNVQSHRGLDERFWRKVERRGADECWPWLGSTGGGYGQMWSPDHGRHVIATHIAVKLATGVWPPKGLVVCHSCDNPKCVNPAHLFVGTYLDNMQDAQAKGRLHWQKNPKPPKPKSARQIAKEAKRAAFIEAYERGDKLKDIAAALFGPKATINTVSAYRARLGIPASRRRS